MAQENHEDVLWLDKTSTDVSVNVEDYTFSAHKVVLSWYSPYLKKVLSKNGSVVKLTGVSPQILQILFNYMYTKDLNLDCQNLCEVFYAARKLKMKDVMETCIEKLRENTASSYLYIYVVSKELDMNEKRQRSYELILKNFEICVATTEFLQLDVDQVCDILSGSPIHAKNEAVVLKSALRWLDHQEERYSYGLRVLSCIRFTQMTKKEVIDCLHPNFMRNIVHVPILQRLLHHILSFTTADEMGAEISSDDIQPRKYL